MDAAFPQCGDARMRKLGRILPGMYLYYRHRVSAVGEGPFCSLLYHPDEVQVSDTTWLEGRAFPYLCNHTLWSNTLS